MANKMLIGKEPEGLLPIGWGIAIRMILGISFLAAQYLMLAKMFKKLKSSAPSDALHQNRGTLRWLFLFTTIITVFYLIIIVAHIFLIRFSIDLSGLIFFSFFFTILFISLYLLAKPSILYGLQGWLQEPAPGVVPAPATEPGPVDEKKPTLSIEQGMAYKYPLETGKNFNELINEYRVDYLSSLLKNSPEYDNYTLEGLAWEAGFNSRNSFLTSVKKKTGQTPSAFFGTKSAIQ